MGSSRGERLAPPHSYALGGIAVVRVAAILSVAVPAYAQDLLVRIGQAVPTVSFLPLWTARALDTFTEEGVRLEFSMRSACQLLRAGTFA